MFGAVWLCRGPLLQIAIFVQLGEDVLGNVGLMLGRGPSEVIELDTRANLLAFAIAFSSCSIPFNINIFCISFSFCLIEVSIYKNYITCSRVMQVKVLSFL